VGGIAAPIFDSARRPLAAVGISGPLERLRPPNMKAFTPEVVRAARDISEALGYTAQ
jgi:DNA-binding IclR family transcriptional regulator